MSGGKASVGRGCRGFARPSLAVLTVAVAFGVLSAVQAYPAFRDSVPNGLRSVVNVAALGHKDGRRGGGPLNSFGRAFQRHDYEWTPALCREDSDHDGESNGLELGDPCCVWTAHGGRPPSRHWRLSHPGNPKSKTGLDVAASDAKCAADLLGQAGNQSSFWAFYYEQPADARTMEPLGIVGDIKLWWNETQEVVAQDGFMNVFFKFLVSDDVLMRTTKSLFTFLAVCGVLLAIYLGAITDILFREKLVSNVLLLVGAFLWTDMASGLLHIVLDNPVNNALPVVGPEAAAFQGHHFDPSAVARGHILDFVREHHILVAVVVLPTLFLHPSSRRLRIFMFHFWWSSHLMMCAHRWSHTHPKYIPTLAAWGQKWGLLMSIAHHSAHHVTYDNNFAIFGGWVNPLLNILVQLHSWRSPLWLFGLIVWGYAPLVLSFEGVYKPVVHQLRSISTSLKATVAGLLGRRTAVLRHNQRGDAKLPTTLTLVCCGREMTGPRARRSGAVVAILAMLTVAWFQLNSGVVPVLQDAMEESKSEGPSHTLLAVHVACMVCGVVLALAGSLAHRIYSPPKQESTGGGVEAAAVPRKWHKRFQMTATALFVIGGVAIVAHNNARGVGVLPRGGMWGHGGVGTMALLSVVTVAIVGWKKNVALRNHGQRIYRWHGQAGFAALMLLILAQSLGMSAGAANGLPAFGNDANVVWANATLLLCVLTAAGALSRLPAVEMRIERPMSFLARDWMLALPRWHSSLILGVVDAIKPLPTCVRQWSLARRADLNVADKPVDVHRRKD